MDGDALAGLSEHETRNRASWNDDAPRWVAAAERNWAVDAEPHWGIWHVPEADLRVLGEVDGLDVVELGCGTAYWSAWRARRGARPVGIDNSEVQLATARRLQEKHGLHFPLHHGNAEQTPFEDASFDLAISEYGASIWADPYRWIPEAARILRPGGQLIFLVNGTILMLCVEDDENVPASDRLLRPYFGIHRWEWPDDDPPAVEFHIGFGDWIRLLRANGFEVEDLIEVQVPEGATTTYKFVTAEWARKWPVEEIWKARKKG
jgi:SAM-dependent methyltransferase